MIYDVLQDYACGAFSLGHGQGFSPLLQGLSHFLSGQGQALLHFLWHFLSFLQHLWGTGAGASAGAAGSWA